MESVTFSSCSASKSARRTKCSVKDCESRPIRNPTIWFHKFTTPNEQCVLVNDYFGNVKKVDKLEAWKNALKIEEVTPSMVVCSLHFKKDDYNFLDIAAKTRRLKKNAVPSCNLPSTYKKVDIIAKKACLDINNRINNNKNMQLNQVSSKEESEIVEKLDPPESLCEIILTEDVDTDHQVNTVAIINDKDEITNSNPCVVEEISVQVHQPVQDIGVKVNFKNKFVHFIKNNEHLSTTTGLESFDILHTITEFVKLETRNGYEKISVKMNTVDRIVMTYVKLKQNLKYKFLAIIFDCVTAQQCKNIFFETTKLLSKCMRVAIEWPSRENVCRNLPQCFEGFENVRVVLDCTEINVQRPKNVCCQVLTYSYYKSGQTIKFMTGVVPCGNITFVSEPYGERTSDSAIFEQSSLITLLEPGDHIMVDKGFLIDEVCEKNQWKLIRLPFLKDKRQLSEMEAIYTARIAKARVHVERSNQRIKTFKLVGSTLAVQLIPIIEDIFITLCGTINLSAPIISDDKFMKPK